MAGIGKATHPQDVVMLLKLILDEQILELNVPEGLIDRADDFFANMDRDMDKGWQMGREWVEQPTKLQRCQIVANKLVTALETENHDLGRLMAGYLLSRAPEIDSIEPDIQGEPQNTVFTFRDQVPPAAPPIPAGTPADTPKDKMAALAEAGKEVSKVFRAGRQWKFTTLNRSTGEWEESPAIGSQDEAERLRENAVRRRYHELCGEP